MAIEKGAQLPDFAVTDHDGRHVAYADLWQRLGAVVVVVDDTVDRAAVDALAAHGDEIRSHDAVLVITATPIAGMPRPGMVVADRWGEIQVVAAGFPRADDIVAWVEYVEQRCPECEGEAR